MRAIRYERCGPAADVLDLVELPDPQPGPGEVRVAVVASGVNPHDTKKRSGWLGGLPAGITSVIPHSDGAGIIDAVGPGVDPARIGERVFVLGAGPTRGTAAEKAVVPAAQAIALPANVGFAEGASIGVPAFTAWLAVLADGPVTGETVLVNGGSGAVGRIAVELAAWNGARVIATAGSPERMAIARARGAETALDYRRDDIAAAVLDLTEGRGVDRIVDVDFGANVAIDARVLRDHGTVAAYSSSSNRTPTLPYYDFALKAARLTFVQGGKLRPAAREAAARTIVALMAAGWLKPDIAARFSLADTAKAHAAVEAGAAANIVVMVREEADG
jgi:NADPH2:quinone reductase